MKETHEQHKTNIDKDELITGPTNITVWIACSTKNHPTLMGQDNQDWASLAQSVSHQ